MKKTMTRKNEAGLIAVTLAVGVAMLLAATGGGVAQTEDPTTEAMVVSVEDTGDATVTLTIPFDLTVEEERAAFEGFSSDEQRQQRLLDRYEQRLSNVAAETNAQTEREMAVTDTRIASETYEDDDVGVIQVTVTWEQLAATDGDQLRLEAPFDSGFETDRTLTVESPENYEITSTTPEPSRDGAVWESGRQLDGFEVTMEPTADSSADDGGAGFGIATAVVALCGAVLASRRL